MTKRHRSILLLTLAIIFIIAAPLIILYSLGWRMDIKTGRINQPGILYLKVNPKNAQIFLDGKLKKKTDFFFGSVLIEKLLARRYEVTIKKDGFYDWQKNLEIINAEATEAKNIVLVPKNPNFTVLFKQIDSIFSSPDGKKMVLKEGKSLKLYEPDKNLKSHLANEDDLLQKSGFDSENSTIESIDILFSKSLKSIMLKAIIRQGESLSENYYVLETDKSPAGIKYISQEIKKADFSPEENILFILFPDSEEKTNHLNKFDLNRKEIIKTLPEEVLSFAVFENSIYYVESSGNIFETDFEFNKHEKIYSLENDFDKNADYRLAVSSSALIIKENNSLYYLDRNKNSLVKVTDQVKDFRFSSDSKKLVYFNNYEIFVLFLEADDSQPQKEAGDQIFLTRFSENIGDVFWYTNYYLIFNTGDKIKVIETDDRDKINIVDLAGYKNPEIIWDQFEAKLHILSEGTLFSSDRLVQ